MKVEIPYSGEYKTKSIRDEQNVKILTGLIAHDPRMFMRERMDGHIVASAVILNRQKSKILLTHHKKMGIWLQLGGHCDGIKDPLYVARKEGYEESGLTHIRPITEQILDIDIHTIPEHKGVPEHTHFDIRYAFWADESEPLQISDESNDLQWVPLDKLSQYNSTAQMQVLRDKLAYPPFL